MGALLAGAPKADVVPFPVPKADAGAVVDDDA